jgi:hypothetical protein
MDHPKYVCTVCSDMCLKPRICYNGAEFHHRKVSLICNECIVAGRRCPCAAEQESVKLTTLDQLYELLRDKRQL